MTEPLPSELSARPVEPLDDASQCGTDVLALFHANLDLVEKVAGRIARELGPYVRYDELAAAGQEGLFLAARRFDPSRLVPFRAYANYRVRGSILDAIRQSAPLPRRAYERLASMEAASLVNEAEADFIFNPRAPELTDAEAEEYLDEHLASVVTAATAAAQAAAALQQPGEDGEGGPEELCLRAELLSHIRQALGDLDEVEGQIIQRMYFEGQNLEQTAKSLNIGKPWACRLHARAIARLTKRLRNVA
jgi:RNA polymerase sigma factor FliA